MSVAELEAFFRKAFPDVAEEQHARIDAIEPGRVRLTLPRGAWACVPAESYPGRPRWAWPTGPPMP